MPDAFEYRHFLDDWQLWPVNCPSKPVAQPIAARGSNNKLFRVISGDQQWLLRCHPPSPCYEVQREQEYQIQNAAAVVSIAPRALYLDPAHRYTLCEYVDGEPVKLLDDAQLQQLCSSIKKLQSIDVPAQLAGYNYTHKLDLYWQQFSAEHTEQLGWQQRYQRASKIIEEYQRHFGQRRCLAHHDLVPGNILWSNNPDGPGQCQLIDWEFAGRGIGSFDFAALGIEFNIAAEVIAEHCSYSLDELSIAGETYRQLCDFYCTLDAGWQ